MWKGKGPVEVPQPMPLQPKSASSGSSSLAAGATDGPAHEVPHFLSWTPSPSFFAVATGDLLEAVCVRVDLCSGESVELTFKDSHVNARSVCTEAARALELDPELTDMFALWIVGNDLELQLKPSDELADVVRRFPNFVVKYTHSRAQVNWQFLYKREALLPLGGERKVRDPVAIRLLYHEARRNVLTGRYPIPKVEDALTLAGIQMQEQLGDIDPDLHKPGFLVEHDGLRLREVLPKSMFQVSRLKAVVKSLSQRMAEWECALQAAILAHHARNRGKTGLLAQLLYLQMVRQWPYYGSTFFLSCPEPPPQGYFECRAETWLIGVNSQSVQLIDRDAGKLLHVFDYDDLLWNCSSDTLTFDNGASQHPDCVTVITPMAKLVASVINRAIANLDRFDRKISEIRLRQSQELLNAE